MDNTEVIKDIYIMLPGIMENSLPKVIKVDLEVRKKLNNGKCSIVRYIHDNITYEFTYYYDKPYFITYIYVVNDYNEYVKPHNYTANVYIDKETLLMHYESTLSLIESSLNEKMELLKDSIKKIEEQKHLYYTLGEKIFE